jgi:hypothetical protein
MIRPPLSSLFHRCRPAPAFSLLAGIALGVLGDAPPPALAQEPPAAPVPVLASQQQMEMASDEFYTIALDLEKPLAVRGLTLKRDTMDLILTEGTIFLAQPIGGRITGAFFTGNGTMRVTIPNAFDRKLMTSVYGKPVFEEAISDAVLRFDDGLEREILAAGKPGPKPDGDPTGTWSERLKVHSNALSLPMDFLEDEINGVKGRTFFLADARTRDGKNRYAFYHDGRQRIEDTLIQEHATGAAGKRWFSILSQFHRPQDYDAKGNYDVMPASDAKEVAAVRNVDMTVEIPNTKTVNLDARLAVEALRDGVRLLRFDLLNNIDAATWQEKGRPITTTLVADAGGTPLPNLHRFHELLILLPRPLAKGERTMVHVVATEDTIIQLTEKSYSIYTTYPWFPQMGEEGGRYTFDWTVKVTKPLVVTGSGDLVKEWDEGNLSCGEWKSAVPVKYPSFIFGQFKTSDGGYKRDAPGTGEVPMRLFTILGGDESFKGNPKNVLSNVALGIKTYESIYGPFPYDQLDIAEMARDMGFAQSPAGILLVSGFRAEGGGASGDWGLDKLGGGGTADQVLFHELAHQWWFHQVGTLSEEDAWISESWAEYSAGLMTEAIDKKKFREKLDRWRQYATEVDPHGTIATAYRSDTIEYDRARYYLLYYKGPYVVHMLRTWMGWDKFAKYVGTIQSKYKGTDINTDTLAREASAVMGYDMFPFFDQWVRDKGIPKVHWSWTAAPDTDGKQIVTIKVRQEDQANFKILMVPIAFDFGKGDPVIVPKPILKAETEVKVKVPTAPKAVRMDPDATQLATFIDDGKK